MPVQAIFFDLDNTLIDDNASLRLAMTRVRDELIVLRPELAQMPLLDADQARSDAFWSTGAVQVEQALSDPHLRADLRLRLWREALTDCKCDDTAIAELARDAYARHRLTACVNYEEVSSVLDALSKRYRLAVITNGIGEAQRNRLRYAGLDVHFELVVASSDVGSAKPEPAIFQHVLGQLGLSPEGVWHVGDSLQHDVVGARNAGLTSVWINRLGATRDAMLPSPHHEIASLRELAALLG